MKEYEILEHSADLRLKFFGKNREELFRNALVGMFASVGPNFASDKIIQREVEVLGEPKNMLIDFLNEALALGDINNEAYVDVKFEVFENNKILAKLIGRPIDRYEQEIKAVTYHGFEIIEKDDGFEATVIFDI